MKEDLYHNHYSPSAKQLANMGTWYLDSIVGRITSLLYLAIKYFFQDLKNGTLNLRQIVWQIYFTGFEAFPLLAITAILFGTVVVLQAITAMPSVGYGDFFGDVMVIVIIRELGPIFTAFLVAGRTGSGLATYLGNMRVESEIDALESLGIEPIRYLVMPAVIGGVTSMVALSIFFNGLAIFAGFICTQAYISLFGIALDLDWKIFLNSIFSAMNIIDVFLMIIKPTLFGFLISGIACHCGLRLKNDRRTVPQAASTSVVLSFIFIIILNGIVTSLYFPQYLADMGISF